MSAETSEVHRTQLEPLGYPASETFQTAIHQTAAFCGISNRLGNLYLVKARAAMVTLLHTPVVMYILDVEMLYAIHAQGGSALSLMMQVTEAARINKVSDGSHIKLVAIHLGQLLNKSLRLLG